MIRVYLVCGHVYETGFLTAVEKDTCLTFCPKCHKEVKITKAFERVHPSLGSRKWVDGAEIKLAERKEVV